MRRAGLTAAILTLGLGGCAPYVAAPQHPAQFVTELDARRLPQKPPDAVWTGADLLSEAIRRNPQIAEARAKYVAALAAARAAKSPPGPSLTLTAEYANKAPRWGYSGASDIPLDVGVRRGARVTTAQLQALQAFYDYGETIWSVRTDIARARSDLDAALQEIPLATLAVAIRGRRAARIEDRVNAGQDARPALILARTELSAANGRLMAANGRVKAAVDDLAKALGVSPAVARPLELAPAPLRLTDMRELPQWRREAATSRRDILRAIADYDIAEQALRLEIANQYPAVSLGPAYNYDHGVTKLPFSLALALPPWDLNRRAIALAEANRAAAGRSLELAQANALAQADAATAALATAQADFFRNQQRDAPLARGAADLAARSAKAGEIDRVDEMAAQGAAADAELVLNDARHVATGAFVDFEDALRRPFDPAETKVIEAAMADAGRAR